PHAGDARASDLAVDQPLLFREPLLDPLSGLEGSPGQLRLLHPIEAEVASVVAAEVVAAEIPALRAAHQLVGLDLALDELVLVLLVVMELQHPAPLDRVVDGADDLGVVPTWGDLEPLLRRIVAERRHDLLARRRE